jgi:hypothetical protein
MDTVAAVEVRNLRKTYGHIELPLARHGFDAAWGSWGEQIVRHELGEFLARHLAN